LGPLDLQAVQHVYGGAASDGANLSSWSWNAATAELTQVGKTSPDKIFGTGQRDLISGGAGDDLIAGFDGADRLAGDAGNDSLFGGAGNDFLVGGGGDDRIYGGTQWGDADAGVDTADYSHAAAAVDVSLTARWNGVRWYNAAGTDIGIDDLNEIDDIIGGAGADLIKGSSAANVLKGGAGADQIEGLAGNDTIDGGIGADSMKGGLGDDRYLVDNALDSAVENAGEGMDVVEASVSYSLLSLAAGVEILTLTGTAALSGTGNALNNVINGNRGGNVLDGGLGSDSLLGGAGNDQYYVDVGGDRVFETITSSATDTRNAGGIDRVYSALSFNLSAYNGVRFVENLTLTGTGNASGTGNTLDNVIVGNSGKNLLRGGAGKDTLDGGAGVDTADYSDKSAAVEVVLAGATNASVNVGGVAEDILRRIENVTGGKLADRLTGDALANTLSGSAGDDVLAGRSGNDTLVGGTGKDAFLFDTALAASTNVDVINDFNVADDTIRLENAVFSTLTKTGTLAAAAFFAGAAAHDASDRIVYDKATGSLLYDSDGTGAVAAVRFGRVSAGLSLTNADFLVT
jgi:Ca2+-binding RTX toxin-like protein